MSTIKQLGLLIGPDDLIDAMSLAVARVKSWDGKGTPHWQQIARMDANQLGARIESVFDAAHGFRHMAFIYRTHDERERCWNFVTRPQPTVTTVPAQAGAPQAGRVDARDEGECEWTRETRKSASATNEKEAVQKVASLVEYGGRLLKRGKGKSAP